MDPEERTVREYVMALQDRLRAAYRHARIGHTTKLHDYDSKVQRQKYQAGDLVWIHDVTLGQKWGTNLQFPWFRPSLITKVLDLGMSGRAMQAGETTISSPCGQTGAV